MQQNTITPTNNKKINPEHEKKFLGFINKKGIPYEKALLKEHYNRIKEILRGGNPPPYELEIQPSSKCNAHCNHCWAQKLKKLEDKLTTKEAVDKVLDGVLSINENGHKIETIKFCGSTGEPLVNPLTLYAIEKIYPERYLRLFTNGIALAENKDNKGYLSIIAKVNRLNVSIDAPSTEDLHKIKPGAWHINLEEILKANRIIRDLSPHNIDIEASYVITHENYKGIQEFARKIKKHEAANRIRFRIDLTDREISKKHGREIIQAIEDSKSYEDKNFHIVSIHSDEEIQKENESYFKSKCSGLRCWTSKIWACIGSNGNLFPCGHIVSGDAQNYGPLLEYSFRDIWNCERKQYLSYRLPTENCHVCSPFSLRINQFLTEISNWPSKEIDLLYNKHIKK